MALEAYRKKRDFRRTPEPAGRVRVRRPRELRFFIQKHHARRLHYDFRLEFEGVLKSWAVPKGPSLDPGQRRLAVEVEDHPIDYGAFEGTIPPGQYGAGTVLLWDRGVWIPLGDPAEGFDRGRLEFRLKGQKLGGRWSLIRMNTPDGRRNWLLIKGRDPYATPGREIVEERTESVAGPTAGAVAVEGVELTNPDRVLFPEAGLTKRMLADYYERISPWILPHVEGRPLTLLRCPQGRHRTCFFQKHWEETGEAAVVPIEIQEKAARRPYATITDTRGLIALVQRGVLELHPWGSRADVLEVPDRCVFDLDPAPDVAWSEVVETAHRLRERLERWGLESFVKTTGGKGLHVVVPLTGGHRWNEVREFSRTVAEQMAAEEPSRYTAGSLKRLRRGKIYVDWLRNSRGATSVAAYSTRARAEATVSAPLSWEELKPSVRPESYTLRTVLHRLHALGSDPWQRLSQVRQGIPSFQPARRP